MKSQTPLYVIVPENDPLIEPFDSLSRRPLSKLCKTALLDAFWSDPGPLYDAKRIQVDVYFEYFETVSMAALREWNAGAKNNNNISSLKFRHVTDIALMMKQNCSRLQIENFLAEILNGYLRGLISEIIDLTVKLLLCVPNWSILTGASSEETTLTWVDGTVSKAFARHFRQKSILVLSPPEPSGDMAVAKLEKGFTAKRLEEAGIKIEWTSNLLDHLKYRAEDRTLAIFHHASFLHYQRQSEVFPPGLLEETMRTLSLLLPSNDPETREWFTKYQVQLHLDPQAVHCRPLTKADRSTEKFSLWRDRLSSLKELYDSHQPSPASKSTIRKYFSALTLKP